MPTVQVLDWGLIDYAQAWQQQEVLYRQTIDQKLANRHLPPDQQIPTQHYLVLCHHPPTYTIGTSGKAAHLLVNERQLAEQGIALYKTNRGGDITCHAPQQLVVYPILDLHHFFTDISRLMRTAEEVVIRTLQHYQLSADRLVNATGVWLEPDTARARKICAMGIRCSRWVTMHGWAINANNDLRLFDQIVPCGIADKAVTSIARELGTTIDLTTLKMHLLNHFAEQFKVDYK